MQRKVEVGLKCKGMVLWQVGDCLTWCLWVLMLKHRVGEVKNGLTQGEEF